MEHDLDSMVHFVRGQMITQEDYTMIADYDCMGVEERGKILEQKGDQVTIKS